MSGLAATVGLSTGANQWSVFGISGLLSLCCASTAALAGGAALMRGSFAEATVNSRAPIKDRHDTFRKRRINKTTGYLGSQTNDL